MKIYKRIFAYTLKFKKTMIVSIVLMIASIYLNLLPTQITMTILDDYIGGISKPWVEVKSNYDDDIVELKDMYLIPASQYDEASSLKVSDVSVFKVDGDYYLTHELVIEGEASVISSSKVQIKNNDVIKTYTVEKLTNSEVQGLYGSFTNPVIIAIAVLAVFYALNAMLNFFVQYSFSKSAINLVSLLRKDMFDKLQRLPINYFQNEADGRVVSKITNDTESVRGLYSSVISILIEGGLGFVIIYATMFSLNPQFALLILILLPLIAVWISTYRKVSNRYSQKMRALNSQINATINENIKGMKVIQAFTQEKKILDEFDSINGEYRMYRSKQLRLDTFLGGPVFGLLRRTFLMSVVLYFGTRNVYFGDIVSYGAMYAFVDYLGKLMDPIDVIFGNIEALEEASVSADRVFEFLDLDEDSLDLESRVDAFKGKVAFEHVNFRYTDTSPYVLKDVSFTALPKQTIGLVGHTGSGKTTTMSLLMRFFNYEEGSIKIDGIELNSMSKQAFRRHVGMVLQNPILFEGTIRSNISLNDEHVTDHMVEDALKSIGADKILAKYKNGIHTEITNMGDNLSTGERQLLSFARAMLYDPSILILDEATANIDTETEQMIQKALLVASKDRTTFIVAHRLSTIKHADRIIVLDGGKILEQGTHDELIANKGQYYKMYLSQSMSD